MRAHEFDRIVKKLALQTRNTDHMHAWLEHEGKVIIKTKRSHGSKPQPHHRYDSSLDEDRFSALVSCVLSRDEYIQILRDKGIF
jgi:hypothetical protein